MSVKPSTSKIPSVKMRGFLGRKLVSSSVKSEPQWAHAINVKSPSSEGMAGIQIERPSSSPIAMVGAQEPVLFRDESDIANFESDLNNAIKNNAFNRDVEQVLDSGIQYGYHNFNPLRDQDMVPGYSRGTPLGNTINYKSGPRCTHMDGQFIMIECPASAANVYSFGTIPHILERIPVGAVIIALTPVNKTVYPHTITPDGAWTIDFVPGDPDSWNEDVFRVKSNRYSGGSNGLARAVVVVF